MFRVNAILHIPYCNLWWYVCKECGKYTVLRRYNDNLY